MRITLVGSLSSKENIQMMFKISEKLKALGHEVRMPFFTSFFKVKAELAKNDEERKEIKRAAIILHLKEVEMSDAILVVNLPKNGLKGYIGPNTFLEIMYAFYLGKRIYAINEIDNPIFKEELAPIKIEVIGKNFESLNLN